VKVRFTRRAAAELDRIFAYICRDNRKAADQVVARIQALAAELAEHPAIGPVVHRDARMRVAHPYPYLIIYRMAPDQSEVQILRVVHAARKRRY
jgi:toxin ParE1/3/4